MWHERTSAKKIVLGALCIILAGVWYSVFLLAGKRYPAVTVFDAGQGDAIFIEAPNGNQVLIDGGPGERILAKLGRELPWWDRSIDVLVLTHPHADHLAGLLEVLERYRVDTIIETGVEYGSVEMREWRRLVEAEGARVLVARAGERLVLDDEVFFDILAPLRDFHGSSPEEIHDAMVVAKLSAYGRSILFTGDAEDETEYMLMFFGAPLRADILKVGHHGSRTSTSDAFLDTVRPSLAVISVGRGNRYGHPHDSVIDTLTAHGVTIRRTDESGDVRIVFTKDGIRFTP